MAVVTTSLARRWLSRQWRLERTGHDLGAANDRPHAASTSAAATAGMPAAAGRLWRLAMAAEAATGKPPPAPACTAPRAGHAGPFAAGGSEPACTAALALPTPTHAPSQPRHLRPRSVPVGLALQLSPLARPGPCGLSVVASTRRWRGRSLPGESGLASSGRVPTSELELRGTAPTSSSARARPSCA